MGGVPTAPTLSRSPRAALAADQFRLDGSEQMPESVFTTFWHGIVELMDGYKTVNEVLADIDASWPS